MKKLSLALSIFSTMVMGVAKVTAQSLNNEGSNLSRFISVIGGGGTLTGSEIGGIQRTFLQSGYSFLTPNGTITVTSPVEVKDPNNPPIVFPSLPYRVISFNGDSVTFSYIGDTLNSIRVGDRYRLGFFLKGGSLSSTIPGLPLRPDFFVVDGDVTSAAIQGVCPSNCSFTIGTSIDGGSLRFDNTSLSSFILAPSNSETQTQLASLQFSTSIISSFVESTSRSSVEGFGEGAYLPQVISQSGQAVTATVIGASDSFFVIPSLPSAPTGRRSVDYQITVEPVTPTPIGTSSRIVPGLQGIESIPSPRIRELVIPRESTNGRPFQVIVGDVNLGQFNPGQVINFANLAGRLGGEFSDGGIRRVLIRVEEERRPRLFVVRLSFTRSTFSNLNFRTASVQ